VIKGARGSHQPSEASVKEVLSSRHTDANVCLVQNFTFYCPMTFSIRDLCLVTAIWRRDGLAHP